MKKLFCIVISFFLTGNILFAQNTFPATGNVGIGNSSPTYNLDINSSAAPTFRIGSSTNSVSSDILFKGTYSSAHSWKISKDPQGSGTGPSTPGVLTFLYHNGVFPASAPTMLLNYTGSSHRVVIGSASTNLFGGVQLAVNGTTGTSKMIISANTGYSLSVSEANYGLIVDGKIGAREVIVSLAAPFPDYVFKPEYKLLSLSEIERHIKQYSRLPEMPSAEQIAEEGLAIARTTTLIVQKIEELTLHMIELNKKVERLEKENQALKNVIKN